MKTQGTPAVGRWGGEKETGEKATGTIWIGVVGGGLRGNGRGGQPSWSCGKPRGRCGQLSSESARNAKGRERRGGAHGRGPPCLPLVRGPLCRERPSSLGLSPSACCLPHRVPHLHSPLHLLRSPPPAAPSRGGTPCLGRRRARCRPGLPLSAGLAKHEAQDPADTAPPRGAHPQCAPPCPWLAARSCPPRETAPLTGTIYPSSISLFFYACSAPFILFQHY